MNSLVAARCPGYFADPVVKNRMCEDIRVYRNDQQIPQREACGHDTDARHEGEEAEGGRWVAQVTAVSLDSVRDQRERLIARLRPDTTHGD
jgi:hypothetical protein